MPKAIEIETNTLVQVTENIVEALLYELTQDGRYSPSDLRFYANDIRVDGNIKDCLRHLADTIQRLARDNMACTCAPGGEDVCITCKLLA